MNRDMVANLVSFGWFRLLLSVFFLAVSWFVRRITNRRDMQPLLLIGLVLVARDVLTMVLPDHSAVQSMVNSAGFVVSFSALIYWTGKYRTSNRSFLVALACNVLALALLVLKPATAGQVGFLLPVIMVGISFVALIRIDRYVMTAAVEVEGMRPLVQLTLIISGFAFLLLPFSHGFLRDFLVVVAALPFWTVVLALLSRSIDTLHNEINSQRTATEHIFEFLTDVSRSFGQGGEPQMILASAVDSIVGASGSESGLGIIRANGGFQVCAVKGIFPPPVPVPSMVKKRSGALRDFLMNLSVNEKSPLWGQVLKTGEPIIVPDALENPFLRAHAQDSVLHLKSMIILPLVIREEVLGLISIARRENARPYNTADLSRAGSMANFVALTLDNYYAYTRLVKTRRLERDIEIASKIQSSVQAPLDVASRFAEIAAVSRPLRGVGGDYYDVVPMNNDRTAVIIGDVAGKGVPAALVMMIIRTAARLALASVDDAGKVLEMINVAVSGSLDEELFATVSVVILDPHGGHASFANAGHHPLLVISGEDTAPVEADTEDLPVGIEAETRYESRTIPFPPRSWGILYTDGIVEAVNPEGEEFGTDRFRETVRRALTTKHPPGSARILLDRLMYDTSEFVGSATQQDDVTMVVFRSRLGDDAS